MIDRRRILALLAVANVGNAALVLSVLSWGWMTPGVVAQEELVTDDLLPSAVDTSLTELGADQARKTYLALIVELTDRQEKLELRESDLGERERQFAVLKEELRRERQGVELLREEVAAQRKKIEELRSPSFDRLLKAYEGMEPENAAGALVELYDRDRMVVVDLLLGMKPRQAAAALDALAAMSPQIAADLSLEIWNKDPERRRR
ncbi:MAG: hypothetical protein OEQ13_03415 [Acidobacteriota bacterium]|nr:hypothetical protein [Acidobacteriota bacterium]